MHTIDHTIRLTSKGLGMKNNYNQLLKPITFSLALSLIAALGCGGGDGGRTSNKNPILITLAADPAEAFNGEAIVVTVNMRPDSWRSNLEILGGTAQSISVICKEGLIEVFASANNVSGVQPVSCYLSHEQVKDQMITNFTLTDVSDGGEVNDSTLDFTGLTANGTRLGFAYNADTDFSNYNANPAAPSGSPQVVISIAKTTSRDDLPTTFEPAKDLHAVAATPNTLCVAIVADETIEGSIENVSRTGSYTFEGRDTENSELSFDEGMYSFTVDTSGSANIDNLAEQAYENLGAGVTASLNAILTNSDGAVNDICNASVKINPFINENPSIEITTVAYDQFLADATTPRDIGNITVTINSEDFESAANALTVTGSISSASLNHFVNLSLNSLTELSAALVGFGGADDVMLNVYIEDPQGGSSSASRSLTTIHKNTVGVFTSGDFEKVSDDCELSLCQDLSSIEANFTQDPEGDVQTTLIISETGETLHSITGNNALYAIKGEALEVGSHVFYARTEDEFGLQSAQQGPYTLTIYSESQL